MLTLPKEACRELSALCLLKSFMPYLSSQKAERKGLLGMKSCGKEGAPLGKHADSLSNTQVGRKCWVGVEHAAWVSKRKPPPC